MLLVYDFDRVNCSVIVSGHEGHGHDESNRAGAGDDLHGGAGAGDASAGARLGIRERRRGPAGVPSTGRRAERIRGLLARGEALGSSLRAHACELVLCHADSHAANILVGDDGHLWLVDWDEPLVAPRERDLLFVVGSMIARVVEPREEDLFFAGYGPTVIDPTLSEAAREAEAVAAMALFAPSGAVDRVKWIPRCQWPTHAP